MLGFGVNCAVVSSLMAAEKSASQSEQQTEQSVDFVRDVMPVMVKAGCSGGSCHGSFQGRGGFQLSLFGFDPRFDYTALVKEARGRRVFPAAAEHSLMLQKPLQEVPHGGGQRFHKKSEAYRILHEWISTGAQPAADFNLHVERIEVEPMEVILQPNQHTQLLVKAHWSDGVVRDVTDTALYEVRDEYCSEVTSAGRIEAKTPGRTAITVSYLGPVEAVNVTIPYGKLDEPVPFEPNHYIDKYIAAEWEKVGLRPVELSTDAEFVRRVYLDLIGSLPTPEEIHAFIADEDKDKRAKLIDGLLERPEYVDYWSYRWADLLRVHRRYVGEKGMWSFWNWVRTAVRENWPMTRLARELLVSQGSLYNNGATAYYFVDTDPAQLGESTAQLFLGVRLQCAKCHHHPYETWSQEDYFGLANFFTRLEIKDNGDGARYGGTKMLRPISKTNRKRRVSMTMEPTLFGKTVEPEDRLDVRAKLADWITSADNPYFARNFVNRYWSYMMGRGLVEPVDDLRATNPPTHPELFEALAEDFVKHNYDVKYLLRTICNSRVYQLASRARTEVDRDGVFYSHRRYHRLPAPVLLDALNFATGTQESFAGLPAGTRAISLPDPDFTSYFLRTFGRSERSSPCECATSTKPDLAQALHLLNGEAITNKLTSSSGRIQNLLKSKKSNEEVIEELYLVTFSRLPTDKEKETALHFVQEAQSREVGLQDVLWALLNSTAFVFGH